MSSRSGAFTVTIPESDVASRVVNTRELVDIAWFDLDKLPSKVSGVTRAVFDLLSKTHTI